MDKIPFLSFLEKNCAFSFPEAMVTAALLAALSLMAIRLNDSASTKQVYSETELAIEALYQKIYSNMENPQSCTQTLGGSGANMANGGFINKIFNRIGGVLVSVGDSDAKKLVRIESMQLNNLSQGSGQSYAEVDLDITFKKMRESLKKKQGVRKITLNIPLSLKLSGSALQNCFLHSMETGQMRTCDQLSGTWDSSAQKCKLPFYGKDCRTDPVAQAGCRRSMTLFDNNSKYSCHAGSVEPGGSVSCPWTQTACNRTCGNGETLDTSTCSCVCSRRCPAGRVLNTGTCSCDTERKSCTLACPIGKILNSTLCKCF